MSTIFESQALRQKLMDELKAAGAKPSVDVDSSTLNGSASFSQAANPDAETAKLIAEAEALEAAQPKTGYDRTTACFGRLLSGTLPLDIELKVLFREKFSTPKFTNMSILYNGALLEVGFTSSVIKYIPTHNTVRNIRVVNDGTARLKVEVLR